MMRIGKTYVEQKNGKIRLCADVVISEHKATLWFAVDQSEENYLCAGSADPFVIALLPCAMRGNHEVICEESISERLYYQLNANLIPMLSFAGEIYHPIRIKAPLSAKPRQNAGAVGTGFSGGVDSLYTIMRHNEECEYPLTHIAVFNSGVFEGKEYKKYFRESCERAKQFAKEQNLKTVFVDTNLQEILPERFLDVYSFRNLACALAVQGLFSVYLLSSGHDIANFSFDLRNSASYDQLTVNCISTETISFYLSGAEVKRHEKLCLLAEWKPSWKWLHPCVYGIAGEYNCGHCKKCTRDQTTLYAMGKLDRYRAVFDVNNYRKYFSQRLAFVLANRGNHLFDETLELLRNRDVEIPQAAYLYEKQFRKSMRNLGMKAGESMEKLSIIIPAYNAEKYLTEAVMSVRKQGWQGETEIVIVNDGSEDGTLAVARELGGLVEHKDVSRRVTFVVLSKERGGAASARNMGIRNSSGELLFFLDADDLLTQGALERLYEPMKKNKEVLAVFGKAQDFLSPELSAEQKSRLQARKEAYGGVLPGCALIRREAFERIGLFDESLKTGETVAWQMSLREAKVSVAGIDCVTLSRRLHLTNTGRVNNRQEMQDYAAILRRRMKKG